MKTKVAANCSMVEAAHDILYQGKNIGKVVLTVGN